jgi:subtilase family serine protease
VLNQGGEAAPASTVAFYLSVNSSLDSSDVAIGSRAVPDLPAGASNSATTTVNIPAGTATGSYYVIAAADAANAVVESTETNNTRSTATVLRIGPDLVVSSLTAPSVAGAGTPIVVSDTTTNQGGGDAPPSKTAFYLSSNGTLDAADVVLGSRSVPVLASGAVSSGSTSLAIPAATPTGTYYVIANADDDGRIVESSDTNNVRVSGAIRLGPDLVESSAAVSPTGGAGGTITVTDTVKNQGTGDAAASTTAFYISTTSVFNTQAVQFGSRSVPPLAAGATNTASTTVTLPAGLATGTYFVFASADGPGQVVETFESNNTSFGQVVRVGPDLTVTSFTAPSALSGGVPATVSTTVLNQGGGAAAATTVRVYLSVNSTLDAVDTAIGTRPAAPLDSAQSDTGTVSVLIPSGTAAGSYWLIAVADADGVVTETNETNNTRAVLITVKAGG